MRGFSKKATQKIKQKLKKYLQYILNIKSKTRKHKKSIELSELYNINADTSVQVTDWGRNNRNLMTMARLGDLILNILFLTSLILFFSLHSS